MKVRIELERFFGDENGIRVFECVNYSMNDPEGMVSFVTDEGMIYVTRKDILVMEVTI